MLDYEQSPIFPQGQQRKRNASARENYPTREKVIRVSPFLAWGDFHARLRFARSTIPEEKWGTTRSLCRCKNFGLKRASGLIEGSGPPDPIPESDTEIDAVYTGKFKPKEHKPPIVNQQNVVYYFKCIQSVRCRLSASQGDTYIREQSIDKTRQQSNHFYRLMTEMDKPYCCVKSILSIFHDFNGFTFNKRSFRSSVQTFDYGGQKEKVSSKTPKMN